jgi:hypothetical protein
LTAAAAATIGVGGLAAPAPADAAAMSCTQAMSQSNRYMVLGDAAAKAGDTALAAYYYGKAVGVLEGAC